MTLAKKTILEVVVILTAGLAIGLTANAMNSRKLHVTRDYFTKTQIQQTIAAAVDAGHDAAQGSAADPVTRGSEDESDFTARLSELGLQPVSHEEMVKLYEDERYQMELFIFVDARNEDQYQEGHIPGAYQLDHYYLDLCLQDVLPICQNAEKIVVYCNGGDCDDSEYAAQDLIANGVDSTRVYIYSGGLTAWQVDGMPLEKGDRLSGECD